MALVDFGAALSAGLLQFGDTVSYQPKEQNAVSFSLVGVFVAPYELVDLAAATDVSAIAPKLGVRLADLPAHVDPKERIGDTFTRAGVTWRVIDVREDGEGGGDLILHRA